MTGTGNVGGTAEVTRGRARGRSRKDEPNYKWIVLSNTTLGVLMAAIDGSIVVISLPAIFNGIQLNPLDPGNVSYLLWIFTGYLLVTAVLVVAFGRLGDIYGRVRMYNAGFLIFTIGSVLLAATPFQGPDGAIWLIVMRLVQAVGGAFLFANSSAILTDAFPPTQRGLALGINGVAGVAGQFIGLILGGVLAVIDWRLVFFVSVPVGIIGTIWAYLRLEEVGSGSREPIDWWGNITFGVGLTAILVGITYGIQPYGGQSMGWSNPFVIGTIGGGILVLLAFFWIEQHVDSPLFHLSLFRIRAFAAGNIAGLLAAVARGGLQFMLVIWLQGIWLPLHGYNYSDTPLWAGIYLLPLTFGFLISGPASGYLSDRFGARPFATGGMIITALAFIGLTVLPIDFPYWAFASLIFLNGVGSGLFFSPNSAGIMNAVPARQRGAASGMRATFQNSGTVISIGVFFSLMVAGLAGSLPNTLYSGLVANSVPEAVARSVANLPPVSSLFGALLGYNPMASLLPPQVLASLPAAQATILTGKTFFPNLIAAPFQQGLTVVFVSAAVMSVGAGIASWLRGGRYVHVETAGTGAASHPEPTVVVAE
jgi:MFS family permease